MTAAAVLEVLDAPTLDQAAFLRLVRAGEAAVPALLAAVGDGSTIVEPLPRRPARALRALRLIGAPAADAALPHLLSALALDASRDDVELLTTLAVLAPGAKDRAALAAATRATQIAAPNHVMPGGMDRFRRWVAKMRLWYRFRIWLCEDGSSDAPGLVQRLSDENPLQRERAACRLGALGMAARAAIPALAAVQETEQHPRIAAADVGNLTADFHDLVRDAAAMAIARIDPTCAEAARGLTLLLARADSPQERVSAAMAIGAMRDADFDFVPALLTATHDDDPVVAGEAVTALGRLGARGAEIDRRLRECADAAHAGLAARARAVLRSAASR